MNWLNSWTTLGLSHPVLKQFFWRLCADFDITITCFQVALWVKLYAFITEPAFVTLMEPTIILRTLNNAASTHTTTIPIQSASSFSTPFSLACPFAERFFWINEAISLHENRHSLRMVWIYHHCPERHLEDNWSCLITTRKEKKSNTITYQLF